MVECSYRVGLMNAYGHSCYSKSATSVLTQQIGRQIDRLILTNRLESRKKSELTLFTVCLSYSYKLCIFFHTPTQKKDPE